MNKRLAAGVLVASLLIPTIVQAKRDVPALNKKKLSMKVGTRYQLTVKKKGKNKVKWSSTKKKVATVNKKGLVVAKKAGTAKIRAKVGKKTLTCKVTVKNQSTQNTQINTTPTPTVKPKTTAKPKTTPKPTSKPKKTPKPTATPKPKKTPKPTATPKPNSIATKPTEDPGTRDDGWIPGWY